MPCKKTKIFSYDIWLLFCQKNTRYGIINASIAGQVDGMAEWILYACGSALLTGLVPVFMKPAAKRAAPVLAAVVFAFFAAIPACTAVYLSGILPTFSAFTVPVILSFLLSGALTAGYWMCLFRAMTAGSVNKVAPVDNLSRATVLAVSILVLKTGAGLWKLSFLVLFLLGTVLMAARPDQTRTAEWLPFALLAMLLSSAEEITSSLLLPSFAMTFTNAARTVIAFVLLLAVAFVGSAFRHVRTMRAENWIFLMLSGLAAGGAWLLRFWSEQLGEWSLLLPISCASLLWTVLFARVCHGERMTGAAALGLTLTLLSMFALLLNL